MNYEKTLEDIQKAIGLIASIIESSAPLVGPAKLAILAILHTIATRPEDLDMAQVHKDIQALKEMKEVK